MHVKPTATEFLTSPYDPQLEKDFFSRVMLPNGTIKTTSEHRLDDLNELALPHIKALPFSPLRICDVAASSGVSSAEWYDQLLSSGLDFQMYATDLTTTAIHLKNGWAEGLFDEHMRPLHLSAFGRGMPPKADFPRGLVTAAISAYLKLTVRQRSTVSLMSKRLSPSVQVECDDITQPSILYGFHVLRAANILHYEYFSKEQLASIIANLKCRLVEGGLFIACRTMKDGSNHGAIFRHEAMRLSLIAMIGSGLEIENLCCPGGA